MNSFRQVWYLPEQALFGASGNLTKVFLAWNNVVGKFGGKSLALPELAWGCNAHTHNICTVLHCNETKHWWWELLQFLNEVLTFLQDGGQQVSDFLLCLGDCRQIRV